MCLKHYKCALFEGVSILRISTASQGACYNDVFILAMTMTLYNALTKHIMQCKPSKEIHSHGLSSALIV